MSIPVLKIVSKNRRLSITNRLKPILKQLLIWRIGKNEQGYEYNFEGQSRQEMSYFYRHRSIRSILLSTLITKSVKPR